jgi:long-chain acyl-CoA synthetase
MNLAELLARAARIHPDRPALLVGTEIRRDYRGFGDHAARLARVLRDDLGLVPGDRLALWMPNVPEYLETLYAAWWAGLVVVPINAKLHPKEVAWILGDTEAAWLVTTADAAQAIAPLRASMPALRGVAIAGVDLQDAARVASPLPCEPRSGDDLAWLFYTSGTTGRPKGVMQTHRNLLATTAGWFIDIDGVDPDDVVVYAAPISHGAGAYNFAFVARAARHVVPVSEGFDPAELVALSRALRRVCLFAAPTMVKRLVDHVAATGADASGFRTIVYGGGPMYAADIERALVVMGPCFAQIYGQGETPMTITTLSRAHLVDRTHPRHAHRIASVGVPHSVVEVQVVDAEGAPCPPDTTGEVIVRGETVMAGYWRNPEATAKALRDGWLHTGDLGAFDADGFLTLKDRSKDLIISGGTNIYPREVEEVLLQHPDVREVAVVGMPDPEWGEIVVAFVVGGASATVASLDALCLDHIARFKRPKRWEFVDALPKNHYGKVLKTELRQRLTDAC